ncbi:hypothetical protein V5O48_014714 [Marasmius crinis-equi]|uniref:Uncharacterized protein n=1 Tax=Marasmius crinis-equi TaxID=585013 RepID=A0ABR3EWJ0_9AGAR
MATSSGGYNGGSSSEPSSRTEARAKKPRWHHSTATRRLTRQLTIARRRIAWLESENKRLDKTIANITGDRLPMMQEVDRQQESGPCLTRSLGIDRDEQGRDIEGSQDHLRQLTEQLETRQRRDYEWLQKLEIDCVNLRSSEHRMQLALEEARRNVREAVEMREAAESALMNTTGRALAIRDGIHEFNEQVKLMAGLSQELKRR